MRRLVSLPPILAWLGVSISACHGAPPCTDSGVARLPIAEARLPTILSISTNGDAECQVEVPEDCGEDRCYESMNDGRIRMASVSAARRGQCQVTIEFSDGCRPVTLSYRFRGPIENCCEDVCFSQGGGGSIAAACADP
jgi:hypothetical protein